MSSIHESLKLLGPVSFSAVPQDQEGLKTYLSEHLSAGKFLVESIPQPIQPTTSRSRAVSSASSSAEISSSSARAETPSEHEPLHKDWGKPVKLSEKENPLGISVFKLAGKDGRGAWFARRSVHEGLSFSKWKQGLQNEFEHSLQIQGGPGSGKVRGLGAEQRPESHQVDGIGTLDVWHVSAQFPGPSAPRDFVSLVMTSDTILGKDAPQHFMIVSTPCEHENCPPQNGLVRGTYESVEFIREIPKAKKAASTTDLGQTTHSSEDSTSEQDSTSSPRNRGRTIGFAESRGDAAKGETIDTNPEDANLTPVEWIMITRSDPGGNVPRFLVERGTPGGIVSDATKFLDWACKRVPQQDVDELKAQPDQAAPSDIPQDEKVETKSIASAPATQPIPPPPTSEAFDAQPGMLASAAVTAQAILGKITGAETPGKTSLSRSASMSSSISSASFASAEQDLNITNSLHSISEKSSSSGKASLSAQEKELLRLANRKAELAEKLKSAHHRAFRDPATPTEKEKAWLAKTQEKHDREVNKAEDRYLKTTRSIEEKRVRDEEKARQQAEKDAKREVEKQKKAERKEKERLEKEEANKAETRHRVEVQRYTDEVKGLKGERDALKENVRALQAENTKLVTLIGKLDGGERLLNELRDRDGASNGEAVSS